MSASLWRGPCTRARACDFSANQPIALQQSQTCPCIAASIRSLSLSTSNTSLISGKGCTMLHPWWAEGLMPAVLLALLLWLVWLWAAPPPPLLGVLSPISFGVGVTRSLFRFFCSFLVGSTARVGVRGNRSLLFVSYTRQSLICLLFCDEIRAKARVDFLSVSHNTTQIASETIAAVSYHETVKNAVSRVKRQNLGCLGHVSLVHSGRRPLFAV